MANLGFIGVGIMGKLMAGAVDGQTYAPVMSVDSVGHETNEALITMLRGIIRSALYKSQHSPI